jgi:hypothetical protein
MENKQQTRSFEQWFPTYGVITADRLLQNYSITLPGQQLMDELKHPESFYRRIIVVPAKNVYNGLICEQGRDYQTYAQKKIIDYVLSGTSVSADGSFSSNTQKSLEKIRKDLVALSEGFYELTRKHYSLIHESEHTLKKLARNWRDALLKSRTKIMQALKNARIIVLKDQKLKIKYYLSQQSIKQTLSQEKLYEFIESLLGKKLEQSIKEAMQIAPEYIEACQKALEEAVVSYTNQIQEVGYEFKNYRQKFRNIITDINEGLFGASEYMEDHENDKDNKLDLNFDSTLGGTIE